MSDGWEEIKKDSERLQFLIDNNARIEKHANLHWLIFHDGATMHDEVIEQQAGSYPSPREAIDAAMSEAEAENFPGFI